MNCELAFTLLLRRISMLTGVTFCGHVIQQVATFNYFLPLRYT